MVRNGAVRGPEPNWPLAKPWPWMAAGFVVLLLALFVPATGYKITTTGLAALRAFQFPDEALTKLTALDQQEFSSREQLLDGVREALPSSDAKTIVEDNKNGWRDQLLAWSSYAPWRFPFLVLGLVLVGGAVSLRLSFAGWDQIEDRATSAGVVALGGLACLLGVYLLDASWDSIQMFLGVGVGVALAGALLILLPGLPRRILLSVLAVVHFGGIFTAVTSVPPPQGQPPQVVTAAWTYFYRPYLQFMYLNNAYHFYSPDPGPPSMLWFAVKYKIGKEVEVEQDGEKKKETAKVQWITLPAREQYRTRQDYQRYLALCEYTNMAVPSQQPPEVFNAMWRARQEDSARLGFGNAVYDANPTAGMFRMPTPYSKKIIASYAKYAAKNFPSGVEGDEVESVKVYRVTHNILSPAELNGGKHPLARDTYLPYFMGEFTPDGKLVRDMPFYRIDGQRERPGDNLLYWALPSEPRFKVTDKTIARLKEHQVPEPIIDKLRKIKGEEGKKTHEYRGKEFLDQMLKLLGPADLDRYAALVINYSPSDTYSAWEFAEVHGGAGTTMKLSEAAYGPSPGHRVEASR